MCVYQLAEKFGTIAYKCVKFILYTTLLCGLQIFNDKILILTYPCMYVHERINLYNTVYMYVECSVNINWNWATLASFGCSQSSPLT